MKNLFVMLVLFGSLSSYAQQKTNIHQDIALGKVSVQGMTYLGDGIFVIKKKSDNFICKDYNCIERKIKEQIRNIVFGRRLKSKILNQKYDFDSKLERFVELSFSLSTKDGTALIDKNEAKEKVLELKEFLDLGLITKEEFDAKVNPLKRILLGN